MLLKVDLVELVPAPAAHAPAAAGPLAEMAFRQDAWTPEEVRRLRELFVQDLTMEDIARDLGRGRAGVADKICSIGLRRNTSRPWSELEDQYVLTNYGRIAASSIALHLGRGVQSVYCRATLLGLTEEAAPPYTEWEDAQLREGYARDVPAHQLAVLIGRTRSSVASRASTLGLRHPSTPPNWTEAECGRLLELAHEGHQYPHIAAKMAEEGWPTRSDVAVGQTLHRLGYYRGWGRSWIPEEDELLRRAYAAGASLAPLRERLGRTREAIAKRAQALGLMGSHPRPNGFRQGPDWTEEDLATLKAKFGTMPTKQLATELGRKLAAVYTRANLLGLNHPWMRAFREDEDRAIAIAWKHGIGLTDLALALNRDAAVVHKRAVRIGLSFGDAARPARAPRSPRVSRAALSLEAILAIGDPAPFRKMKYRRAAGQAPVPAPSPPAVELGTASCRRSIRKRRPLRHEIVLQRRLRPLRRGAR